MKISLGLYARSSSLLALVLAASPVSALLNDPPYFNLWGAGQVDGAGLSGSGSQVLLCGTAACGSSAGTADHNYAIFNALDKNTGRGSGAINPFLRFDQNIEGSGGNSTTEAAFNTDFRDKTIHGQQIGALGTITSPDGTSNPPVIGNQAKDSGAGGSPGFNHAVIFNTLVADTNGYFHFMLDINEPGGDKATLRLDELAFFTSASNTLNKFQRDNPAVAGPDSHFADATASQKIWDMDFNKLGANGTSTSNTSGTGRIGGVIMDSAINNTNGSGDYDIQVLLHKDLFANVKGTDYVYLYNFAGAADSCTTNATCGVAEAGFEEWATDQNPNGPPAPPTIPEPGSLALLIAGFAAGHFATRTRRRAQRRLPVIIA